VINMEVGYLKRKGGDAVDPILTINYATLAEFLEAAEGNYRNAIYIKCTCCKYSKSPQCKDFLFIPGHDCRPVLIPICDAEIFLCRKIDRSDCAAIISNITFRRLYNKFFELYTISDQDCPVRQILEHMNRT